jgi:mxaJ protein
LVRWLLLALFSLLPGEASALPSEPPPARVLRVCADPGNLPFSNQQRQGFENQIAQVLARRLRARLEYTWWAQRRGFFRNTLNAGVCDVVIGAPSGLPMARTTRPYYRSTFAFITRSEDRLSDLRSLDDPRLRYLKIGVPLVGDDGANPAPVLALARRGLASNLAGFSVWAEFGRNLPAAAQAVAARDIDVAVLWGPVAGAAAKHSRVPLTVRPVLETSDGGAPLAFSISMAVRRPDAALAQELDVAIQREQAVFSRILSSFGVPLLELTEGAHEGD